MSADPHVLLCRLCQRSGLWYVNIFLGNGTDGALVSEVIREVIQLQVHKGDGLPATVCHECCKKLGDFRDFKKMCVKSADELLRRRLLTVEVKEEEDDSATEESPEARDLCEDELPLAQSNNEGAGPSILLRPVEVFLNANTDCDMTLLDSVLLNEMDPLAAENKLSSEEVELGTSSDMSMISVRPDLLNNPRTEDKPSAGGVAVGTPSGMSTTAVRPDLSNKPPAAGTSTSSCLNPPCLPSISGTVSYSIAQSQPATAAEKAQSKPDSTVAPSGTQNQQNNSNAREDPILIVERMLRDTMNPIEHYSDVDFNKKFSFSKRTVINIILPMLPEGGAQPIPSVSPMLKLLTTLRYYATGSFQVVSNELPSLRTNAMHEIIKHVAKSIAMKLPEWVKMPTTEAEISPHRRRFYQIAEFPGVIGCVDCTHIPVINPGGEHWALFVNRKKWFSMNVQVVIGSSKEIMDIVCRWYGSMHDSQIFLQSRLRGRFVSKELKGLLLGDSAYPLMPYLYTPVPTPVTGAERRYNIAHARTMNVVVKGLAMWKRRFPCLTMKPRIKLSTSLKVIVSTAVLHNIAVSQGEPFDDLEYREPSLHVPVADYRSVDTKAIKEREAFIKRRFSQED